MVFKPVEQAILHDPDNGKYGDCYPACIASVLGIGLDEIPHFYDADRRLKDAQEMIDDFFKGRGLSVCTISFGKAKVRDVLGYCGLHLSNTLYVMSAGSPRFSETEDGNLISRHAVVGCGGHLIHDPHPDKTFVVDVPDTDDWGVSIEIYTTFIIPDDELFDIVDTHIKAC